MDAKGNFNSKTIIFRDSQSEKSGGNTDIISDLKYIIQLQKEMIDTLKKENRKLKGAIKKL